MYCLFMKLDEEDRVLINCGFLYILRATLQHRVCGLSRIFGFAKNIYWKPHYEAKHAAAYGKLNGEHGRPREYIQVGATIFRVGDTFKLMARRLARVPKARLIKV